MENTDSTPDNAAENAAENAPETSAQAPAAPAASAHATPAKKRFAWHTKLALALLVFLPIYFMIAALGTKIGLWDWQTGLGVLTIRGGPIVMGLTALAGVVSLIISLIGKPRSRMKIIFAAIAIIIPAGMFASLASLGGTAASNPIHDVSTDTANPPAFSAETLAAREASGANPLSDYQTPLGEIEMFAGSPPELAIKSHAQIINDSYASLSPLPLGGASKADAVAAVAAAMGNMGFADIRTDVEAGRVEGVAETFWFGFKDDVVARVGEREIDFRSTSRVGRSDLGANAARIAKLRELVAAQIGQR